MGGGIYGVMTGSMTDSVVTGNRITCNVSSTGACNTQGAGLWINAGFRSPYTFTIRSSEIEGNTAGCQRTSTATCQVSGGGLYVAGGTIAIAESAIAENEASSAQSLEFRGGGIYVAAVGTVTVDNSTLSGNIAAAEGNRGYGGAIYVEASSGALGTADLIYATIADNAADFGTAFALTNVGPSLAVMRSIIASADGAMSCWGMSESSGSGGFNVFTDTSCGSPAAGDQLGVDPGLGDLADNGGPTRTHGLLAGSPAIDAAGEAACAGHESLATDQRGFPRPADGDGDGTAVCDIGAYEAAAPPAPTPTETASPTLTATPSPARPRAPRRTPRRAGPLPRRGRLRQSRASLPARPTPLPAPRPWFRPRPPPRFRPWGSRAVAAPGSRCWRLPPRSPGRWRWPAAA
ncbi:MAG: hypothetical protein HYV63_31120 [Candidatus Schekmanbacteria bacterium]|nr:hypothetical protein [Candidatus Schekmanbacteria bacterium]